jgi:hypothetical protein
MGWKTQTILVRPAFLYDGPEKFLQNLGYAQCHRINDSSFAEAGSGSVWVGSLADCIVIYTPIAFDFFNDENEDTREFVEFQNALLKQFPEADIAVVMLQSVVDGWGFAVFQKGNLIRRQHGFDGNVLCDEGVPLIAETNYLSQFDRIEKDGSILYRDPLHIECNEMGDADLGEGLVFEICRSFTGFALDSREFDAARGTNFWFSDTDVRPLPRSAASMSSKRPWWKFWG